MVHWLGRLAAGLQPVADDLTGYVTWAALVDLAWEMLPSTICCSHAACTGFASTGPCLGSDPQA